MLRILKIPFPVGLTRNEGYRLVKAGTGGAQASCLCRMHFEEGVEIEMLLRMLPMDWNRVTATVLRHCCALIVLPRFHSSTATSRLRTRPTLSLALQSAEALEVAQQANARGALPYDTDVAVRLCLQSRRHHCNTCNHCMATLPPALRACTYNWRLHFVCRRRWRRRSPAPVVRTAWRTAPTATTPSSSRFALYKPSALHLAIHSPVPNSLSDLGFLYAAHQPQARHPRGLMLAHHPGLLQGATPRLLVFLALRPVL